MSTITCTCAALGSLGKLLTESSGAAPRTFNNSSLRHEFVYETIGTKRNIASSNAINGHVANLTSSVRSGTYLTQGAIAIQASPKELRRWLPRIFGGTITGTSVSLSNNLPAFDVLVYRENGIFQYTDAVVAQAVLRGKTSSGGEQVEFMELIVQVVGKEERINQVAWPSPEPALATTVDWLPYAFFDSNLVLNSLPVEYEKIDIIINNNLDVKFFNKRFPSCLRMTNREIKIGIQAPFTCDNLSTALSLNETAGSGTFTMSVPGMSTSFQFPGLRNTFETPTIKGRATIPQTLMLEAFAPAADGVNVVITQDDTP